MRTSYFHFRSGFRHESDGIGVKDRLLACHILYPDGIANALSRRMSGDIARQAVYIGVGISGLVTLLQQLLFRSLSHSA